jgi:hypothetical protein
MAQWGKNDQANNSPIFAPAQFNLTPNTANRDALFGNTSANSVGTGEIVGVFGISADEMGAGGNPGTVYSVSMTNPGTGYTSIPTVAFANGGIANAEPAVNATGTALMRLISVTVGHGGNNYAPGDVLTLTGGTASVNATLNVVTTEIRSATVNAAGSGYTNGDIITLTQGTGTAANAAVTTNGTGNVASVTLSNNGVYTVNPTSLASAPTTNSSGTGVGLTLVLVPKILSVAITNTGVYSVIPTPLTNNPSINATGVGVSANINLVLGVANVVVSNTGSGYVTAPAVSFSGGGGSAAAATAVIYTEGSSNVGKDITHSGWVVRKVGTGGRAGRIQYETLVAGGIATDASDDTLFPDA